MATFSEDLDAYLTAFGETVTVGGTDITAIVDTEYSALNLGIGIESSDPQITCKTSDVSSAQHGTAVTMRSASYTVSGPPEPDGTGMTVLKLEEA